MSQLDEFMDKAMPCTRIVDDCWLWGRATSRGYGVIWWGGRNQAIHRVSYELFIGPIPEKFDIHHTHIGLFKRCFQPLHLEAHSRKNHSAKHHTGLVCMRGHDLTVPNAKLPDGHCRKCDLLIHHRAYWRGHG